MPSESTQPVDTIVLTVMAIDAVEPILGAVDAIAGCFQDVGEWQVQLQL